MKLYTIGEIYRLKLLKNHNGEPYKHKGTIAKIVSKLNPTTKKSPWGLAVCLSEKQINDYNNKWKEFIVS